MSKIGLEWALGPKIDTNTFYYHARTNSLREASGAIGSIHTIK